MRSIVMLIICVLTSSFLMGCSTQHTVALKKGMLKQWIEVQKVCPPIHPEIVQDDFTPETGIKTKEENKVTNDVISIFSARP